MKRITQSEQNPFPFSDSNKRYHTYDYYLRTRYGGKCAKVTLDAGFTCPNIDGRCGRGGCIYCSGRGSGDFAPASEIPLFRQYEMQAARIREKWDTPRLIPYLQAHTNTYAPVARLREVYEEVLSFPHAVALHIATRADCIDASVAALLSEVAERIDLTVELGLQSVSDETARRIGRGHDFAAFLAGYRLLRDTSPRIRIAVHLINGLPGEKREEMLASARTVASLRPDEVKIHLLHVLRDTALARLWERGEYTPMTKQDYVDTVVEQLRFFPPETVIGRLTGDGARDALLSPEWSLKKLTVVNEIDKKMYHDGICQGDLYKMHN